MPLFKGIELFWGKYLNIYAKFPQNVLSVSRTNFAQDLDEPLKRLCISENSRRKCNIKHEKTETSEVDYKDTHMSMVTGT